MMTYVAIRLMRRPAIGVVQLHARRDDLGAWRIYFTPAAYGARGMRRAIRRLHADFEVFWDSGPYLDEEDVPYYDAIPKPHFRWDRWAA